MDDLSSKINHCIKEEIPGISSLMDLESCKHRFLGKKGLIVLELKKLATLPVDEKKAFGQSINICKERILKALEDQKAIIQKKEIERKLKSEKIDLSLPSRSYSAGTIHPITHVKRQVLEIFNSMGFTYRSGPDLESDYYNFSALNIPEHHPARAMHDTFYMENGKVLRTHTSSVQIRAMENSSPPFKFISMGRTYRCDYDATHTPMFHQIEGVYIDEDINMSHLKGCLDEFLKRFFDNPNVTVRLRPSYFPFTEPSAEVDISLNQGKDWLEILGCGMVHPNVLKNVGIDSEKYQGFAFGMGIERITMLKYGMKDLRPFFDADLRWSNKYGFSSFDIPSLIKNIL
ncbi:MAG: phenylalanine--tRNA ligase subunit alpha [Rickettsiales bacterium]